MKQEKLLNFLRIIFILFLAMLIISAINNPKKTQTNLLKAILSDTPENELIINLSRKFSSRLNIIFESEDTQHITEAKEELKSQICSDAYKTDLSSSFDLKELLNTYKYYNANLLSPKTRAILERGDLEEVKLESMERLYNPLSINLAPIEEDPFLFFDDYIDSLPSPENHMLFDKNGKFYEILNLSLKDEIALSPSLLNVEIKKLINIKENIEHNNPNVKIYLAGSPVHTYSASSKSMTEINIICLLSALFIILLCKLYFKTLKILLPIALSLLIGLLSGYSTASLFFSSIHILTFVFSTTLIGICVDYSLHYFAHSNDLKIILKSLTVSMLTTVCAFLMLLFSHIELLNQIAVFTSAGLFTVYAFVVLFYPLICRKIECEQPKTKYFSKIFFLTLSKKQKLILLAFCLVIITFGLFQLNFNDDIKDMYKPSKDLIKSEALYSSLIGNVEHGGFIIIEAQNTQDLLEKEEEITKYLPQKSYYALSRFLPSAKQQNENKRLKKNLYEKELNNYASFLNPNARNKLLYTSPRPGNLTEEKIPELIKENFIISPNHSVIYVKYMDKKTYENITGNEDINYIELKKTISSKVSDCRRSCAKIFLPAILVLLMVLSIIYKPKAALIIALPSVLGGIFTLSLLSILHIDINLFHIMALFLIIGFSIDYSIFRYNAPQNSTESNTAVLISCSTTVFSFLLLSLTSFKLISSLGLILALGLTCSYILSLIFIQKQDS